MTRTTIHGLEVDSALKRFIDAEVLPGTGVDGAAFWQGFDALVRDLAPKNAALLAERDHLQTGIDGWHRANPGPIRDMAAYRGFLAIRTGSHCSHRLQTSSRNSPVSGSNGSSPSE